MASARRELVDETTAMLAESVSSTLFSMFNTKVNIRSCGRPGGGGNDYRFQARLTQDDSWAALTFAIDRDLMQKMVRNIFSEEDLQDGAIYESAASEVTNVVCSSLKTFLNSRGYEMSMGVPYRVDEKSAGKEDVLAEMVFTPENKQLEDRSLEVDFFLHG
jgi:chemotaxis protein CheY-P-specific phosphatase CheC